MAHGGCARGPQPNCSATTSAPRAQCSDSISSPAHTLVPPGHRAEHGGASIGTTAPAEMNQPVLTRALTGKAFPLLRDSFASTDLPLSYRTNHRLQACSVLASAACHRSWAGWFLPSLSLHQDGAWGAATAPWPCHLGRAVPLLAMHRLLPAAHQWSFLLWGLLTPHWVLSFLLYLVELQLLLTELPDPLV